MAAIYAMLVADVLFVGFLLLTRLETGRGGRFMEVRRARLDHQARKIEFILQHVDWGALMRDTARTTLTAWAHEAATRSLMLVRSTERFLTRAVQALSTRRAGISAGITQTQRIVNVNAERLKHGIRAKKIVVSDVTNSGPHAPASDPMPEEEK